MFISVLLPEPDAPMMAVNWPSTRSRSTSRRACTSTFVPVWSSGYFGSQDGPAHLQNAQLLLHAMSGQGGRWQEFYAINPRPVPNWVGHLVLAGLMSIFSPLVAEKLLVSGYLILLPIA